MPRSDSFGRISRRKLLQFGVPALGLGLADVLRGRAAAESTKSARKRSLIVFWTHGGMSQQDTYDMKPDAPPHYRGIYKPIATSVPGVSISERFPRQAALMHKIAVVRSVHHGNGIHAPSAHWMQTGYFGPTLARNAPKNPSFGSVIAKALGSRASDMPLYVTIPKSEAFGYQGSVYLGAAYQPFEVGSDPNARDFKVANVSLPGGLSLETLRARSAALNEFDTMRRDIDVGGAIAGLDTFKSQALRMVTGERVRAAFDIEREDPRLRERYGRHSYGQGALLARRLIEAGSTCVTVNTGYWDHHDDIYKNIEPHLAPLDTAIAALIEDLERRGMLDDVLIYCAGEFGRTPLINGNAGRDHWPNCFSVMLAGGGIRGGTIVGASEARGGDVRDRPATPQDVLATIYHALGIPLELHFPDAAGRPTSIVGEGKPIGELLA